MVEEILIDYGKLPFDYNFTDIVDYESDFEKMEERFYDVDSLYSNILGWAENHLEFCPNNEPPDIGEVLAWLWVIHPEWKDEILKYADKKLKKIIMDYLESYEEE